MTNYEKHYEEIIEEKKLRGCSIGQAVTNIYCKYNKTDSCYKEESLNWLFEEYKEPPIKLSQLEADLLEVILSHELENEYEHLYFNSYYHLNKLKDMGWFKDVKSDKKIKDIIKNIEVI